MECTRREALTLMAGASAAVIVGAPIAEGDTTMAETNSLAPAYRGDHQPKPKHQP